MKTHDLERAKHFTPGGSQTNGRRHGVVGPETYPAFASGASDAYIFFEDGERAIDMAGANAACPLGFNHPSVTAEVSKHLGNVGLLSLPTKLEAEVSERFVNLMPFTGMVRWVRTGSEAVSGAVAIAQELTNKQTVGRFAESYHGWHPWTRQTTYMMPSLFMESDIEEGRYESAADWKSLAAVLIESPRWTLVDEAYSQRLERLKNVCKKTDTLLIYDDVVYGFRFATSGLQEDTMVRPDIACFSKGIGNGVPVACLVGKPEVMQASEYRVSSTFGSETMGLAAANAVLKIHEERDVCGELLQIGVKLQSELHPLLLGTPISISGTPQHFKFESESETELDKFLSACMDVNSKEHTKLLIHRSANNVNLSMDESVLANIVRTISHVVEVLYVQKLTAIS